MPTLMSGPVIVRHLTAFVLPPAGQPQRGAHSQSSNHGDEGLARRRSLGGSAPLSVEGSSVALTAAPSLSAVSSSVSLSAQGGPPDRRGSYHERMGVTQLGLGLDKRLSQTGGGLSPAMSSPTAASGSGTSPSQHLSGATVEDSGGFARPYTLSSQ